MAKKTTSAVAELTKDVATKAVNETPSELSSTFIETNCVGFDLGLTNGKGVPEGSMILMYSEPATGKTTITADILYRLLTKEKDNPKYRALYIDVEGSRELLLSMGLGQYILSGKLVLEDSSTLGGSISFDHVQDIYDKVLSGKDEKYKNIRVIAVDSLSGVTSKTLLEASVDKADFGSNAKERERFYRKYVGAMKEKKITNFFIGQVRHNTEAGNLPFASKVKPAVSEFDMHWMDFIIRFTKKESANNDGLKKHSVLTSTGETQESSRFLLVMSTKGAQRKNRLGDLPDINIMVKRGERIVNTWNIRSLLINLNFVVKYNVAKKLWKVKNEELLSILNIPDATIDSEIPEKVLNTHIRSNISAVKKFLKERDLYKHVLVVGEEEDDGM